MHRQCHFERSSGRGAGFSRRALLAGAICIAAAAVVTAPRLRGQAGEAAFPELVEIPEGSFIRGSDPAERDYAYGLDEKAYGHSRTREWGWYDREAERSTVELPAYSITRTAITNAEYAAFVRASGHPAPDVDRQTWDAYGLIHPYERTRRFAWEGGVPPAMRAEHPVVLVSHDDARAYADWLSHMSGRIWRLPSEVEWEKAARGENGAYFPWGNSWNPALLNSHDAGPFDTMPVGSFPAGASPYGLLDAAGQVFEWTATPAGPGRYLVKGGSWDDSGCGVCRPAARHGRPAEIRHILIGFRLVVE